MRLRRFLLPLLALPLAVGCASVKEQYERIFTEENTEIFVRDYSAAAAGTLGAVLEASELGYFEPEYIAGALIAYSIYDPFAPTWQVRVTQLDEERRQLDLRMKLLVTGGEGEARQVFLRSAQKMARDGGYVSFDIVRYEEGMEPSRPFARRVANGEIRLVRSRLFPGL